MWSTSRNSASSSIEVPSAGVLLEQGAYGVRDLPAAAVPDGDVDDDAVHVAGLGRQLLEPPGGLGGQEVQGPDRVQPPAALGGEVRDRLLDDHQQLRELRGRTVEHEKARMRGIRERRARDGFIHRSDGELSRALRASSPHRHSRADGHDALNGGRERPALFENSALERIRFARLRFLYEFGEPQGGPAAAESLGIAHVLLAGHRAASADRGVGRTGDEKEADAYWATRPRESQIGAWASRQSEPLARRDELLLEAKRIAELYEGREIPRPARWSGFRVVPDRIEFWKNMPHRLHERVVYERDDSDVWKKTLLNP